MIIKKVRKPVKYSDLNSFLTFFNRLTGNYHVKYVE